VPVVRRDLLKEERKQGVVPLNKIPQVADLANPEWRAILDNWGGFFSMTEDIFHRKIWEFTQIIYILNKLGYLYPKNTCLAVGAGREEILYYLANIIDRVVGIDLYHGLYLGSEDNPDIVTEPQKYAPFLYPLDHLELKQMNALEMQFPAEHFDFVFSASSIEHFGSIRDIKASIAEMFRVLKPGGVCVITSEIKLNRLGKDIPQTRMFTPRGLADLFLQQGFSLAEEGMDLRVEDHYLHNWVKLPQELYKYPHVILRFLRTIFTSLSLTFFKPGHAVKKGERRHFTYSPLDYSSSINVQLNKKQLQQSDSLELQIELENKGNFDWFSQGVSHRIAIGIKLLDAQGQILDPAFAEIILPQDVPQRGTLSFRHSLNLKLKPGRYQLLFSLKRELVVWFIEKGQQASIAPLEIFP